MESAAIIAWRDNMVGEWSFKELVVRLFSYVTPCSHVSHSISAVGETCADLLKFNV